MLPTSTITITISLIAFALFTTTDCAADNTDSNTTPTLPQGNTGIASQFPGDSNINSHPAVIAVEDFETGETIADLRRNHIWTDINNKDNKAIKFDSLTPPRSTGTRSIKITATRGQNTGGHLFASLPRGYDQLHTRFYVRFAPDAGPMSHFVLMCATADPKPWFVGKAGVRPPGDAYFITNIDARMGDDITKPSGFWHFYTYWHKMHSHENEDGSGDKCFGNDFTQKDEEKAPIPRGKWICVEFMMKANSAPDKYDGEQAFWIDGKLIQWLRKGAPNGTWLRDTLFTHGPANTNPQPFEGFNWRNTNNLKINQLFLSLFVSDNAFKNTAKRVLDNPDLKINPNQLSANFDHVVLATQYIGPIQPK